MDEADYQAHEPASPLDESPRRSVTRPPVLTQTNHQHASSVPDTLVPLNGDARSTSNGGGAGSFGAHGALRSPTNRDDEETDLFGEQMHITEISAVPPSQPYPLPTCCLGGGYYFNSYFAQRLCRVVILIVALDSLGIILFWHGEKTIEDGGLYVANAFNSLGFKENSCASGDKSCGSCDTVSVYAMTVYHLMPLSVLIGLPATGLRFFEPFRREVQYTGSGSGRHKVKRTLYLQLCELVGAFIVVFGALIVLYFCYSFLQGNNFNCDVFRVHAYAFGAVVSFFLTMVELTYFARFREHLKMQLGAFKEADQTGDIRSRIAQSRSRYRSERSEIIKDIRKKLFKETELGNLREIENIVLYAQTRLGDDFAEDMYTNAKICCGFFGKSKKNPLHIAAYRGNIPAMALLVQAGFQVNSYDKIARVRFTTGDLFWHFVRPFIARPVQSAEDSAGSLFRTTLVTPLHCAVSTGQITAVKWLIDHGASVSSKSKSTYWSERIPPLFVADNPEIVTLLMEAGANHLEVPDPGRMNTLTVLQVAYLRGNIPVAQELERWGGDVALTPLHEAAAANNMSRVNKLLKFGVDPNCLGEHGYYGLHRRTPLHWGAINGAYESVEILLNSGADPNFQDSTGRTPLHWAAAVNRPAIVALLLQRDADPHLRDSQYMTPLLCAAATKNVSKEMVEYFVHSGASLNESLPNGDTALHIAMKCEHQETALALLAAGGDIMRTNREGFRPVDCTTSTKLQFEIKRAAGNRDVMISYTHSHAEFARKLRKSLEDANITTWLDLMDPSGIGGGAVWREEIARGIKNAVMVVCIFTEDYAQSEWCLKELALAKSLGVPIMAISTEHAQVTEDLQVYLYTRQMVPFEPAITSVDNANPRQVTYTYDDDRYAAQFHLLLDGVRDEIEKKRKDQVMNGSRRHDGLSLAGTMLGSSSVEWDSAALERGDFVFISHGDQHDAFVQRVYSRLRENGVICFLDGAQHYSHMTERIHAAKEAILRCACFIVLISSKTGTSELVKDQLAFAEDKGRTIMPIMLNEMDLSLDRHYTLSRMNLYHFAPELGFNASFTELLTSVRRNLPLTSAAAARPTGATRPSLYAAVRAVANSQRALNRSGSTMLAGISTSASDLV